MNEKIKTQNGITLIALIITIIVMLILVAVTINMAINGGLFSYAGRATSETQDAIDAEKEIASGRIEVGGTLYNSIDDYLNDIPLVELPEGIKVGDYVNYTPDTGTYKVADGSRGTGYTTDEGYQEFTTESFNWRILSIDEATGKIELVAETQSSTKLTLQGADGYNHAVDILNDLCETLYSKTEDGKKVATGRSINVEDVNAKTTYDYTTITGYGSPCTPSSKQYPNIYMAELGSTANGLNETEDLLEGSEGVEKGTVNASEVTEYTAYTGSSIATTLNATNTYYSYAPESYLKDLGINTAPAGLIKTGTTYWLASRCVSAGFSGADFYVRCVYPDGSVYNYNLFGSYGYTDTHGFDVRPVVSLASSVKLTKDTTKEAEGVTYWNLSF